MVDCRAIARAISDPENQPHQWNDQDLAEFFVSAADEIERLRGMLIFALDGLDDYWITLPEGVELVDQIKALQQKEND